MFTSFLSGPGLLFSLTDVACHKISAGFLKTKESFLWDDKSKSCVKFSDYFHARISTLHLIGFTQPYDLMKTV
jgi:hypothetical protein